ncbi:MAG TPA: hypothetical protein VGB47_01130 [Thermoanaerobaculia bacterium]
MTKEVKIQLTAAQKAKIKAATGKTLSEIRVSSLGKNIAVSAGQKSTRMQAEALRAQSPRAVGQEALRGEALRGEALRGEALRGEALRGEALRAGDDDV